MSSPWDNFQARIEPFRAFLGAPRLTCVAVKYRGEYVCLALRILWEPPGAPVPEPVLVEPLDGEFLLVDGRLDHARFSGAALAGGRLGVRIDGEERSREVVLMPALPGGPGDRLYWGDHDAFPEEARLRFGHSSFTVTTEANGSQFYHTFGPDQAHRLDAWLIAPPRKEPSLPADGLNGWLRKRMPGVRVEPQSSSQARLQLVAPISVKVEFHRASGDLIVSCPPAAAGTPLGITFFFEPGGETKQLDLKPIPASVWSEGGGSVPFLLEWPNDAERAKVSVVACGKVLDRFEITYWEHSGNIVAAIGEYFDPGHRLLRARLSPKGDNEQGKTGGNQRLFEDGVATLLSLLGLRILPFHPQGAAAQSRPDMAVVLPVQHAYRVLLIECTTRRPGDKCAELAERAEDLKAHLGADRRSVSVRGAVFTRAEPSSEELATASGYGLRIIGRDDLKALEQRLAQPLPDPVELFDCLVPEKVPSIGGAAVDSLY